MFNNPMFMMVGGGLAVCAGLFFLEWLVFSKRKNPAIKCPRCKNTVNFLSGGMCQECGIKQIKGVD